MEWDHSKGAIKLKSAILKKILNSYSCWLGCLEIVFLISYCTGFAWNMCERMVCAVLENGSEQFK